MTFRASRREFLKGVSQLSVLGAAAPLGLGLAAATRMAGAATVNDYKALVCVFLYGGNDNHNTIIPFDVDSHSRYAAARAGVSVSREDLQSTVLEPSNAFTDSRSFALHPELKDLKTVFDSGKLSLLMNVGTLIQPTTLDGFNQGIRLPPKLMSHNDQFSLWQSLEAEGSQSGWGGRMGDIFASHNGSSSLLTNMTVGPSAKFSSGESSLEFSIGARGPVDIGLENGAQNEDIINLISGNLGANNPHLIHTELKRKFERLKEGTATLNEALDIVSPFGLPETQLGRSLEMVARIIGGNSVTRAKRQVFFVGMGGFDSHGSLTTDHPALLAELGKELANFQTIIDSLGLANQVTTFTASDFGRALTTNGRGSDHGWGGHHFVMGGSVKDKTWAGALPSVELGGADDVGQGRLLPAVSVDQYGATLAKWMGLSDSELSDVFPNIGNFNTKDLGFMHS